MTVSLPQAQKLADQFPPLLIEAERVAQAVQQGIHGRRRSGVGETFWQFRRYEQGDPVERIDWRQSSRTDKIYIREREWEAAQSAYLWTDNSGSMHYASQQNLPSKAQRAQLLMLALSSLALRGGERVTWLNHNPTTVHGKNGLEQIAARINDDTKSDTMPPDLRMASHSHVILCSDFLMPPEQLQNLMRRYAAMNIKGALVHILDPAEEHFNFQGRLEMRGLEGETPLLLPNAAALSEAYQQRLAEHKARIDIIARSAGWFALRHITSQQPHLTLMQLFQRLSSDRRAA